VIPEYPPLPPPKQEQQQLPPDDDHHSQLLAPPPPYRGPQHHEIMPSGTNDDGHLRLAFQIINTYLRVMRAEKRIDPIRALSFM